MAFAVVIFALIIGFLCSLSSQSNPNRKVKSGGYRMGKNGCWYPYGSAWYSKRRR